LAHRQGHTPEVHRADFASSAEEVDRTQFPEIAGTGLSPAARRAIMKRVRLVVLIACVLVAATSTATAASAAPLSEAQGKACLQSHGFRVANRPDLGAASVTASDWFVATRGAVEVDVAYFSNVLGATYARAVLAALTKSTQKGLGMTGLRQSGRVVYWWRVSPARYGPIVQACLGR
jgi:hypothetical protein